MSLQALPQFSSLHNSAKMPSDCATVPRSEWKTKDPSCSAYVRKEERTVNDLKIHQGITREYNYVQINQ